MAKKVKDIIDMIRERGIKMVDFKMVDIAGQFRHVTIPAEDFGEDVMRKGIGFDASNYGYAVVEKSDMVFIPDPDTAMVDPFSEIPTLSMGGDVMIIDAPANRPLPQGWEVGAGSMAYYVNAKQSYLNSYGEGKGVVVPKQKAYHIAKPYDTSFECRSEMCLLMEEAGIKVKYHHPEVGASGQFEIEPMLGEMSRMADATMTIKYIIKNTAAKYGKSATLMPKPVYGEAGSGMHVHMLLMKDGEPVFADDKGYARLSETAHYFMGGLLKHIASLCAITNPSTNSFKRLIPGYEAPVTVGYAMSNRSAVIRIPAYAKDPAERRFELRNPDATCNPYFCYAAILMAGLDGVKNKIDPHTNGWGPYDVNLYHLPEEEKKKLKSLPATLDAALDALEADHDYLTAGGVFPEELIRNFINLKRAECHEINAVPNPAEFDKYYNS